MQSETEIQKPIEAAPIEQEADRLAEWRRRGFYRVRRDEDRTWRLADGQHQQDRKDTHGTDHDQSHLPGLERADYRPDQGTAFTEGTDHQPAKDQRKDATYDRAHQHDAEGPRQMLAREICRCQRNCRRIQPRSEEHTSALQSLMRIS